MNVSGPSTRHDNTLLAVAVILVTVLALSLGDALIKQTSVDLVLWQIFVLRSMLVLPVLAVAIRLRNRGLSLMPQAFGWTAARSLMLTLMWVAYYASLLHLPLSIAAAVYYTLPIFITLFAAIFIGDTVGRIGWAAIFLGFGGVALILKPVADDFNFYALLPLISAILYAFAMILTRTKCRQEHPLVLSVALNVSFIAVGLFATGLLESDVAGASVSFLSAEWTPIGMREAVAIGLLAISILIGSIGAAIAYQTGPSSVVATFDFAYVGFAAIWGFIFFGERPDALAFTGMLLIVVAGILTVRR